MMDYRPGNILDKQPVAIKAAVVAVAAAVLVTWPDIEVSGEAVAMWGVALELVLGLFVHAKSTSNSTAQVLVEGAAAAAEVKVKAEVDEYLSAVAADEQVAGAGADARLSEALSAAEGEIAELRAQLAGGQPPV